MTGVDGATPGGGAGGGSAARPSGSRPPGTAAGLADRLFQQAVDLGGIDRGDPDALLARPLTGDELEARPGDPEHLGEQVEHGSVRPAVRRRGRHPDPEGVAVAPDHGRAPGTGLDAQTEDHVDGATLPLVGVGATHHLEQVLCHVAIL